MKCPTSFHQEKKCITFIAIFILTVWSENAFAYTRYWRGKDITVCIAGHSFGVSQEFSEGWGFKNEWTAVHYGWGKYNFNISFNMFQVGLILGSLIIAGVITSIKSRKETNE